MVGVWGVWGVGGRGGVEGVGDVGPRGWGWGGRLSFDCQDCSVVLSLANGLLMPISYGDKI